VFKLSHATIAPTALNGLLNNAADCSESGQKQGSAALSKFFQLSSPLTSALLVIVVVA